MAYTGSDLYNDLKIRVYQGGAGAFLNANRANYIIWTAIKDLIEKRYNTLIKQSSTDEINKLIKVDQAFTHNGDGVVSLKPLRILSVSVPLSNTYRIKFDRPHNFPTTGANVVFQGLSGGIISTQLNDLSFSVFWQSETEINVSQTGASISGYSQGTGYALMNPLLQTKSLISDYYHLLAVAIYGYAKTPIQIQSVDSVLNRITLKSNNIRNGEKLFVYLPGASTNPYGFAKMINRNTLELYTTSSLTTKVTWTGTYTGNGLVARYMERYAEPNPSDTKISPYDATEYFPLYQLAENELLVQPLYEQDMFLKVDYITTAAEVSVNDSTRDLLQDFNWNFIGEVIELSANKFFAITSSPQDVQITTAINQGQ